MFITLEGIEGAGKSSQMQRISDYLEDKGRSVLLTREPGDTAIGKKIREILLNPDHGALDAMAELFLYAADRRQHMVERVLPALKAGTVVVCDRFFDATTAYQGYARGIDLGLIYKIHDLVLEGLKPDLTFLFDLDPVIGLERAWGDIASGGRPGSESRFEREKISFHARVREGYLSIAEREKKRFHILDASKTRDDVTNDMLSVLNRMEF